jgi:hypothetical protein
MKSLAHQSVERSQGTPTGQQPLWAPSLARIAGANRTRFIHASLRI